MIPVALRSHPMPPGRRTRPHVPTVRRPWNPATAAVVRPIGSSAMSPRYPTQSTPARPEPPNEHQRTQEQEHQGTRPDRRRSRRRRRQRHASRRPRRADPAAPGRARRPALRDRHPRHRRRRLRVPATPRADAEPGRHLRQLDPGPQLRTAGGRPRRRRHPHAQGRGEVLGPPARRVRQRRRPRHGAAPPALRRADADPPDRADQPRDRPQEPQPAAGQPGQPDRQGPARAHRQPAQGGQDDAAQAASPTASRPTTRRSS